ncbi:STAS domain-containing protein [Streptomyces sp. TRM68367]|uniref:STAS domain-containing protein n=1 Tax=Streptomyces sp. TRM68367 TaxID=2758415 RepID=UPI00165A356E|nr:STAS domain-containing protein [Streptomyces sp. TRM68367]MBC9724839.1 STAS domain-containing protein [Streptomyces sp. TRM68367]
MTPEAEDAASAAPGGTAAGSAGPGLPAANAHARTRISGPFTVVEVTGEIDVATADLVAEHLDAATARPEPDVLVDLRSVAFFDCSGLRLLCRAGARAERHGGRVRVVCGTPRIRRLLRASGLLARFPPLPAIPGERE